MRIREKLKNPFTPFFWRMLSFVAIALIFVAVLSACGSDDEETPVPTSPALPTPKAALSLQADVHPLPQPNKYNVVLKWNSSSKPTIWVIQRKVGDDEKESTDSQVVNGDVSTVTDAEIQPGKTYTYYLGSMNDPQGVQMGRARVTIPTDLEILTLFQPKGDLSVGRLFLRQKSKIQTSGRNLKIAAQEIIADDAVLETFAEPRVAPTGQSGRAGGEIFIQSQKASGHLTINGNGETGGPGIDGGNGADGQIGASGTPGDWGMHPDLYKYLVPSFVDSFRDMMRRYPKPYTDSEWTRSLGNIPWYICAVAPTPGGTGGKGSPGIDGGRGGNGGDSAAITLTVQEDSDFKVDVDARPGEAGIGGRGGNGGKGGPGGNPGALDQGHRCPAASAGAKGEDALAGRPGKYGTDGTKRAVCIKVGSRLIDCPQH